MIRWSVMSLTSCDHWPLQLLKHSILYTTSLRFGAAQLLYCYHCKLPIILKYCSLLLGTYNAQKNASIIYLGLATRHAVSEREGGAGRSAWPTMSAESESWSMGRSAQPTRHAESERGRASRSVWATRRDGREGVPVDPFEAESERGGASRSTRCDGRERGRVVWSANIDSSVHCLRFLFLMGLFGVVGCNRGLPGLFFFLGAIGPVEISVK